jgi:hypothetical protein
MSSDHDVPTVRRSVGMPADAATVRALVQDAAASGWAVLPDHPDLVPRLVVRESGAGASEVQVEVVVPRGRADAVGDLLDAGLVEMRRQVLARTSDAS